MSISTDTKHNEYAVMCAYYIQTMQVTILSDILSLIGLAMYTLQCQLLLGLQVCYSYLCSVYWCSVYGICKPSDTLWPAGRVRLFADYTISLSSLCRLIWRHWTNKMLVRYMLPSVCLRLRLFSQLSFIQYMRLCVLTHRGPVDLRKWAIFSTILMSPKSWLSQEDLDAGCKHSMVPMDS